MSKISGVDLKLLRYICKYEPVSSKKCIEKFGEEASIRLNRIYAEKLIEHQYFDGNPLNSAGLLGFVTTIKGRVELQDARYTFFADIRRSLLIPILSAFVTAVITVDVWPHARSWMLSTLQWLLSGIRGA